MEYKFRGFDAVGKKGWVYGDLVHNKKVTRTGLEPRVMVGGYEVVPESVGVWIGSKDGNGKPIYVGDIVCVASNKKHLVVVSYDEEKCCFIGVGKERSLDYDFCKFGSLIVNVVGNAFQGL